MTPSANEPEQLDRPPSVDALYLYRGDQVNPNRPLQTGDVLEEVAIPGLPDGAGTVIVLTHPCSMRSNGVDLMERLHVARVVPHDEVKLDKWGSSHFRLMPLPHLAGEDAHHAVRFADFGLAASEVLASAPRVACLDPVGINLLQQRFIFYMTRFIAGTQELHESCVAAFVELDLMEEWTDTWGSTELPVAEAAAAFHEWIREETSSGRRQDQLRSEQHRAPLRREMRQHLDSLGDG